MFGRLRHLVTATTGFFGVAAVVWAGSGYLPAVGPVPLRFRPLPEVFTNAPAAPLAEPPVSFIDLPAEEPAVTNAPAAAPSLPVVVPAVGEPYTAEAQSPSAQPAAHSESGAADPVVSPEMLVKYFMKTGATNAPAGAGPQVGFAPPTGPVTAPIRTTP